VPAPDGRRALHEPTGPHTADDPDAPRQSVEFYHRTLGDDMARPGELVLIRCVDGPDRARFETFPPRLEIRHQGGVYVLEDDGPVHRWTYRFVSPS